MTAEEHKIEEVLNRIRECVDKNRITVASKERKKNQDFLRKYLIETQDKYNILKELTTKNYCESILERQKFNNDYDDELYVFGLEKKLKLRLTPGEEIVQIYIKTQFFKMDNDDNEYTLLISFHEAEKTLKYMFR